MKKIIFNLTVIVVLLAACITACSCAGCERACKTLKSDLGNGLYRKVTVFSYNGDVVAEYVGKFDCEDSENKVETYFDLNDKRVIIQGGIVVNEEITEEEYYAYLVENAK